MGKKLCNPLFIKSIGTNSLYTSDRCHLYRFIKHSQTLLHRPPLQGQLFAAANYNLNIDWKSDSLTALFNFVWILYFVLRNSVYADSTTEASETPEVSWTHANYSFTQCIVLIIIILQNFANLQSVTRPVMKMGNLNPFSTKLNNSVMKWN